ncbi:MAG: hypothetical protein E6J91_30545 [Deltaproteobacteria bacterium]|nr:MAG: hypothetical protein E6J91_30545 [Deltaproteobacteria bacterium]
MRIGWHAGLALAAFAAATGRAHADPQVEKADQLFAEGKALMASNLVQACEKFELSLQYNPAAIGTLLNVALCDEKLGKIASAVTKFSDARNRAQEQGLQEHLRAAEQHLAALEPLMPHLSIQLTEPLPDTAVLVDGHTVASDSLQGIPIDPGERVVVVSAVGRLPYRVQFVIARAEHKTIVVPRLARSVTVTSSWRRIGQITTIAGSAAFATSIGLAVYGRYLHNQQFDQHHCMNRNGVDLCDAVGQPANERARTFGNVATYLGAAGLIAAGVGGYLWYRSPRSSPGATDKTAIGRF